MASEWSELAGIAGSDSQSEAEQPQEAQSQEAQHRPLLARLIDARNRDLSLFVPFLLSSTTSLPSSDATDTDYPDQDQNPSRPDGTELETDRTPQNPEAQTQQRDRIVLVNARTQEILVIEGENISSFFENLPTVKKGQPPASKSSIEAMPTVETKEGEVEEEGECAICLDDWEIGRKLVKEMPCKHRFHGDCIEKWLEIHGSCPICRYKMPVEEEEGQKEGGGRGRVEREILVRVSFISSNRDGAHHGELTAETGERS